MKIVFMGTPDFSVYSLQAMIDAGHEILLVVTQPDREKGRGKEVSYSPVKECALKNQIPVFQPLKIKSEESVKELLKYPADLFVVAAFGQILSKEILEMPRIGCINVHASLLPKYRGAAPIQWAIINGEKETGVTIMQMAEGLDTGDMISKVVVPITDTETGESLHDKLAEKGAKLLVETLPLIETAKITPVPQEEEQMTYAKMLTKELGYIQFQNSAVSIERLVRGLNSWPSAYTKYHGKTLKIWETEAIPASTEKDAGTVIEVCRDSFSIQTGKGILKVWALQLEGKKKMKTEAFLLGNAVEAGMCFPS